VLLNPNQPTNLWSMFYLFPESTTDLFC